MDIKMSPVEFGEYLIKNGYRMEYEGDGEDYARYIKDNIKVCYYGNTVRIYPDKSKLYDDPSVLFVSNCSFDKFKRLIDKIGLQKQGT